MLTGIQEDISYCSPRFSSGNQKKARSTNQLQFRIEYATATFESDQFLLAHQKLATKSNSAKLNNTSIEA